MSYERNETPLRAVARPKHLAYEDRYDTLNKRTSLYKLAHTRKRRAQHVRLRDDM